MGVHNEEGGEGGKRERDGCRGGDLRDNVNALPCASLVTVLIFRAT